MRILAALITCSIACSVATKPATTERLYVVRCDGNVDLVSTDSGKRLRRVDVAAMLPIKHSQSVAGSTFDNCLLNQAIFSAATRQFYSLVPDRYSEPQKFEIWRFAVPSFAAEPVKAAPNDDRDLPILTLLSDGSVGSIAASSQPSSLDLKTFTEASPDAKTQPGLRNEIIETSGTKMLLRLYEPSQATMAYAVADQQRKTIVRLQGPMPTIAGFAHLAPGGSAVYVENATGTVKAPIRDGTGVFYNAITGRRTDRISNPRLRSLCFLAITPMGRLIYFDDEQYAVLELRQRFSAIPVSLSQQHTPAYFSTNAGPGGARN